MNIELVKVIILTALLFITLLFSMLPLFIMQKIRHTTNASRRHYQERIISFLSCLGGGVFLGTCFLDLFPEVRDQFVTILNEENFRSSYPFAEFVMVFGFLLILITEQIILSWRESRPELQPLLGHSHSVQRGQSAENYGTEHSTNEDANSHSNLRALLLVFALSLHSIFEGLAIGLQPNVDSILQIFAAVTIHKSILAFTIGLNLIQSKLQLSTCIVCNCLFSFMSPIGIGIGITITDISNGITMSLVNGVLQGIACGSFLYVTFFEVLLHELNNSTDRLLKLFCVVLGYSGISILVGFNPI